MNRKFCKKCSRYRPVSKFYKNRSREDGLCSCCIECMYGKGRERRALYKKQNKFVNREGSKKCGQCQKSKAKTEFYTCRSNKDGLRDICISCFKMKTAATKAKNRRRNEKTTLRGKKRCSRCKLIKWKRKFGKIETSPKLLYQITEYLEKYF